MLPTVLRRALAALVRHPRELSLANACWFACLVLPLLFWRGLSPGLMRGVYLLLWVAWGWLASAALCAAVARIVDGRPLRELRPWARAQWLERLSAFGLGALGLGWAITAFRFYGAAPLPRPLAWGLGALSALILAWLALSLLLSQGLAADGPLAWRRIWRAAVLLPLAYTGAALGLGLLGLLLSGLPVLFLGAKHWSAPLLLAPLILSPILTGAYFSLVLVLLVRSALIRANGGEPPSAPPWRELWNPWR